jgi:hypothetical protein
MGRGEHMSIDTEYTMYAKKCKAMLPDTSQ